MTGRKRAADKTEPVEEVEQVDELPNPEEPDLNQDPNPDVKEDDGANPVDDDVPEELQDTDTPPTPLDPLGLNTYPDPENTPHTP